MCLDDTDKGREAFSKVKTIVRKIGARTKEALMEAIAEALRTVTLQDALGWFADSGYWTRDQHL